MRFEGNPARFGMRHAVGVSGGSYQALFNIREPQMNDRRMAGSGGRGAAKRSGLGGRLWIGSGTTPPARSGSAALYDRVRRAAGGSQRSRRRAPKHVEGGAQP